MASRSETRERREKLAQELRATQRTGQLRAGEMLPLQRELADRYGLSMTIVGQELQKLIAEGVFYSLPRLGTFVGPRRELKNASEREFYILFVDSASASSVNETLRQIRLEFEDRITQLGGSVLLINEQQVKFCRETGKFPQAAGAFEIAGSFGDDWPNDQHPFGSCSQVRFYRSEQRGERSQPATRWLGDERRRLGKIPRGRCRWRHGWTLLAEQ